MQEQKIRTKTQGPGDKPTLVANPQSRYEEIAEHIATDSPNVLKFVMEALAFIMPGAYLMNVLIGRLGPSISPYRPPRRRTQYSLDPLDGLRQDRRALAGDSRRVAQDMHKAADELRIEVDGVRPAR